MKCHNPVNKRTLERSNVFKHFTLYYANGCCVAIKNGWPVMCTGGCSGILKNRHYIICNLEPKLRL